MQNILEKINELLELLKIQKSKNLLIFKRLWKINKNRLNLSYLLLEYIEDQCFAFDDTVFMLNRKFNISLNRL